MVTVDDVAKLVTDRLAAVASFATAVPGGAFFDRGPDSPDAYPYCVFRVEAREQVNTSGDAYTQAFVVRLAAYVPVGDAGADPNAVQQSLAAAFGTAAANTALRGMSLRNPTEGVRFARPLQPSGAYDRQLRDGRDVFRAGYDVELFTQGDRSVA